MANELAKTGVTISPAGMRVVWPGTTWRRCGKRLKALEAQVAALEKGQRVKEGHGTFESECPGYSGAQDTSYVGTF